jgi:hypothetical protein
MGAAKRSPPFGAVAEITVPSCRFVLGAGSGIDPVAFGYAPSKHVIARGA